jgi:hypothetical protein
MVIPKSFELPKAFEDCGWQISRFAKKPFEKWQADMCCFSNEFLQSWETCRPVERKGTQFKREYCIHLLSSKVFGKFKRYGVKNLWNLILYQRPVEKDN